MANPTSKKIDDFLGEAAPGATPPSKKPGTGKRIMDDLEQKIYSMEESEAEMAINSALMMDPLPNVCLVGETGVGKTTILRAAFAKAGLHMEYFNTPTLDPFLQLVGVPEVVHDEKLGRKTLEFIRRHHLDSADVIFLDELNRVSNEKQNALFELVNDKAINGVPLPKLKAVWAAINPQTDDESRAVAEIEDALRGRFWMWIEMPANPKVHHFTGGARPITEKTARALCRWWHKCISIKDDFRRIITPRVLEFIGVQLDQLNKLLDAGRITQQAYEATVRASLNHAIASRETKNITIPTGALYAILNEQEEFALKQFRNDSPDLAMVLEEIKTDPNRSTQIGTTLYEAQRKAPGEAKALLEPADLGHFSKILLSINKEDGVKVLMRPPLVRYYYKMFNSSTPHFKNLTVAKPTADESAIYNRFKAEIDEYATSLVSAK